MEEAILQKIMANSLQNLKRKKSQLILRLGKSKKLQAKINRKKFSSRYES